MKHITTTDTIFVTIMQLGRIVGNIRLSGISSASHLKSALAEIAARFSGMVSVLLRNSSQGWSYRYNLMVG